jgi:hypothetical protein
MMRSPFIGLSLLLPPVLAVGLMPYSRAEYEIQSGDTLSKLARSKFGNLERWKEIYELNKTGIKNPDLIYPGQRLKLMEGEAGEMLAAAVAPGGKGKTASDADDRDFISGFKKKKISEEWRLLPLQGWEKFVFKSDPAIDPDGFDRRSKVFTKIVIDKTSVGSTIAGDRIPILGEVVGARSDYMGISMGDQVFVRQDENIQVGTTYSLTPGPEKVESERDGRVGFIYPLQGKVRIIGVRDGLFIGTVISAIGKVHRNQLLIPEVKHIPIPKPIPAKGPIEATVMTTEEEENRMISSQQLVFLDVGKSDGIKNGMIFRHFLHEDPFTKDSISSKDFLIESELMVLEAQDRFSVALVIQSRSHIKNGSSVISLTDLKDLNRHQGLQTVIQDNAEKSEVNELDQLDSSDGLGEKERQDLRQLEKWTRPVPADAARSALDEEIQQVDMTQGRKPPVMGQEPAPNDGSDKTLPPKKKEEATETSPETVPAPGGSGDDAELPPSPEVEVSKDEKPKDEKPKDEDPLPPAAEPEPPAPEKEAPAAPTPPAAATPTPAPAASPGKSAPDVPPAPEMELPPSPEN